jgi:hypothetical protein
MCGAWGEVGPLAHLFLTVALIGFQFFKYKK